MKFSRICFGTALFLSLTACAYAEEIMLAPKEIIEDYFDIADNYAFAGDYKHALEYIDKIIKFEPKNAMAKYKQALLLTTMNKTDEARSILAEAIKLDHKFANSELAVTLSQGSMPEVPKAMSMQEEARAHANDPIQVTASNHVYIPDKPAPQQQTQPYKQTQSVFQYDGAEGESEFEESFKSAYEPSLRIQPMLTSKQEQAVEQGQEPQLGKPEQTTQKESNTYNSDYYNQLGLQYLNDGDNKTAYEYLQKAVETNKNNFEALNNLGLFYWQQGDTNRAEEQFLKAHRANVRSTKPLLNLGLLCKEKGKDRKYYQYIKKALEIDEKDYLANWVMGNYYAETARPMSAITYYKKAIDFNPDFYDGYVSLGNILSSLQRPEEAYEYYTKALKINNYDPILYYYLSKTSSLLDKQLEAKEYILSAISLAQNDKYYLELAKILSNMGDYEESLSVLLRYFADTQEPEILNYIGLAYYKIKQPDIAIDYFKKLLALEKTKTIYYYNLALCYKALGERDKFFEYVDKATKIQPKVPQDFIDLSYVFFDNGNKSFALNILNEGITAYPNDKKLYQAKLSLYKNCNDTKNYTEFKKEMDAKFNTEVKN